MNKGLKFALFGGALALGFYLFTKLKASGKLQFYPKLLRLEGKKIKDFKVFLDMDVVNPSAQNLTLDSALLNIKDGTTELGRIFITSPKTIEKQSTTILSLPITLSKVNAIFFLYEIIAKGKTKITIEGEVRSEGINVPILFDIPFI